MQGIAGDFMRHLDAIPRTGRKLVIFLGSTVGNLDDEERARFLTQVRNQLRTDDALLIGFDLVKDAREMVAAYDDSQGLTAEFNRNLLRRLNRELGSDFDLDLFTHLAIWNAEQSRIEIYLRAVRDQVVHLPGASGADGDQREIHTPGRRSILRGCRPCPGQVDHRRPWPLRAGDGTSTGLTAAGSRGILPIG